VLIQLLDSVLHLSYANNCYFLTCAVLLAMQIIVRKVYHLLAMGLFVPVFFWDLQLLALSLAIAFAVLVLLEVLRCTRLPLLGQSVQDFMQVKRLLDPG
jgi:hypothetical protein